MPGAVTAASDTPVPDRSRMSRSLHLLACLFHFSIRVASQGSGFVARKEFTAEGDSVSVGAETDPLAV